MIISGLCQRSVVALAIFHLHGLDASAEHLSCDAGNSSRSCLQEDASLLSLHVPVRNGRPEALSVAAAEDLKGTLENLHATYLQKRESDDLDSLNSVRALSDWEVNMAIRKRDGLSGQAAFSPIPTGCDGWNCLSPGMSGNDNGQGLRAFSYEALNGPAAAHLSLSWDKELIYFHARMLGEFFKDGNYNAILGPGANVWRNPGCGRSWEYVPGEDPIFGVLVVEAWTLGLNEQFVSPVLKHFISNDKERDRMLRRGKDTVPWASQMDTYLKPFVAGSNIGASSTMCGYNWLVDPEGGEPVSACFNKRLKWLNEASNRTWIVTDYPAAEQWEVYNEPISRVQAGHSWANWGSWKTPLEYEHRDAVKQFAQAAGVAEEDNGHQIMANNIESVSRAEKDRFLAGFVGWSKDLGVYKSGRVYTRGNDQNVWARRNWQEKDGYYRWVSRTIAESLVLLKNENNVLPLHSTDRIALDRSCTGRENAKLLTAHGSGEMQHHLFETTAETAFRDKTGGSPRLTLACSLVSAGEGSDRENIAMPKPNIKDPARTCVFVSGAGSTAIPWADEVACIIFGLVPSVHAFTGVMYLMYGVVNPSSHLIMSVVKAQTDLEFSDGETNRETGYMQLQSRCKAPAFEFGWGLPFGIQNDWTDIVELIPSQHERNIRRIAFCFRAKFDADPSGYPLPSPTAQFYAQVEGRPWKQLLTFAKFRYLKAHAKECMAVYYDPVAEWEGQNNNGKYMPKPFKLFFGLNGYNSSQAWPADLDQGEDMVAPFDRQGYPAHVWRRHLANQRETGNQKSEGKIFTQKGRITKEVVINFWQQLESPNAAVETAVTLERSNSTLWQHTYKSK